MRGLTLRADPSAGGVAAPGHGLRFEGRFYSLDGVHSGPVPAHRIEIWLGVYRPLGLALTGRLADGWLPSLGSVSALDLAEKHARIDEAAAKAGRKPGDIRRLLNVSGGIGADELSGLALAHGFDTFILWFEGDVQREVRRFAAEVAPVVRASVERARASSP